VLVTENGVATDDEALRRDALFQHLHSLAWPGQSRKACMCLAICTGA
jgi:hypothetical protein